MDLDYIIFRQMAEEKAEYCSAKSLEFLVSLDIHDRTCTSDYYQYWNNPINVIRDSIVRSTDIDCFNTTEVKMIANLGTYWDSTRYTAVHSMFLSKLTDKDRKKYQCFSNKK